MIWKNELKKVLISPAIWGLLFLSLLLNGLLVWQNVEPIYEEVRDFHNSSEEKISQDFFEEQVSLYDNLDMMKILDAKAEMSNYHPKGKYKEFIDTGYEKLNQRIEEIKISKEAEEIIYPGVIYRLHSSLYVGIFRPLLIEMALLTTICILLLMDYERLHKTEDVIYANTTGRGIQKVKWAVGTLSGLAFGAALMAITLLAWFLMIPYKNFGNVSVSAALMAEPRGVLLYPFITYEKMTVLGYLSATVLGAFGLILVVSLMAGVFWFALRNSYLAFLSSSLFLMGGLYLNTISFSNWADIVLSWNPTYLYWLTGTWFMEGAPGRCFRGSEVISIGMQILIWFALWQTAYSRFAKYPKAVGIGTSFSISSSVTH